MGWLRRPTPLQRRFMAMGTFVTATLIVEPRGRFSADQVLSEIESELLEFGRDAWAWGNGLLADFNRRLAAGMRVEIPASLRPLFEQAWAIHRASGGLFEPRIASLVRLWGFDDVARTRKEPPSTIEIDTLFAALQSAADFDGGTHYGPARNVGWDFGGIAKGYIVDHVLDGLRRRGYRNVSLDAGGNLAVRGQRNDRPWRIGIRDPRSSHTPRLLATLDATDEAIITHGDDQRYFEFGSKRYSHLLDPRSGWPAQGLRSLTVVHRNASVADAAGGALFVAGASGWRALAAKMKIDQVLVLTDRDELVATETLAARLRASEDGPRLRAVA